MNRNAVIGIAIVACVPIYVGLSWATGQMAHSRMDAWEQEAANQVSHIYRIAERTKTQGIFSSTETVTLEFQPEFAAAFKGIAGDEDSDKPLRISLRNDLQHGPLPGFRSFGLARIETRLVLDEGIAQRLQEDLGVTEPFVAVTRVGFFGGGTTNLTSPAFSFEADAGEIIEWQGIEAEVSFDGNLDSFECEAEAPGLVGRKGDEALFAAQGLSFDCDFDRVFDELYAGDASFGWKHLSLRDVESDAEAGTGTTQNVRVDDLRYTVRGKAKGDYYDAALDATVGSLVIDEVALTDLAYQISLNHLHGKTLAALAKQYREMSQSIAPDEATAGLEALGLLAEYGPQLLQHSPELIVERIGFRMPEGEFGIKGSLKVPELTEGELQAMQAPMQLLSRIEAAFDIWLSEGLLEKDWYGQDTEQASATRSQNLELLRMQVAASEQAGYVRRKDGRLETRVELKNGALTLNGKPFGPGM